MGIILSLEDDAVEAIQAYARSHRLSLDKAASELVRRGRGPSDLSPAESARSRGKKRAADRKSLAQLFAESPLKGLSLKFERDSDTGRPLQL